MELFSCRRDGTTAVVPETDTKGNKGLLHAMIAEGMFPLRGYMELYIPPVPLMSVRQFSFPLPGGLRCACAVHSCKRLLSASPHSKGFSGVTLTNNHVSGGARRSAQPDTVAPTAPSDEDTAAATAAPPSHCQSRINRTALVNG